MRFRSVVVAVAVMLCGSSLWAFNAEDLLSDLNKGEAEKALAAAMRLGDFAAYPEVVTALAAKLDDAKGDPVLRAACAKSLARSSDKSVYPMLQTLAKKEAEKAIVRAECVAGMASIRGDDAIGELVEILKTEKNRLVREQIETSLVAMKDLQKVTVSVTPLMRDDNAGSSAIRILGTVGGAGVVGPLSRELTEGKASTRRAIIYALGAVHQPTGAKALIAYYPKANDAEKVDILAVLSTQPVIEAVTLLTAELENPKSFAPIRRRAALSLGALRHPTSIKPLSKVLLNTAEQDGLRITCAQALGEYSDHDDAAIAALIGALADKKVAEDAGMALNRMTHRYFGTDKDKWAEWFQKWRQEREVHQTVGH